MPTGPAPWSMAILLQRKLDEHAAPPYESVATTERGASFVFHFPSGLSSSAGSSIKSPRIEVLIMAIINIANCRVGLKSANMKGSIEQQLISMV